MENHHMESTPFFCARKTLWNIIKNEIKPTECEEVKRIIGATYIEENEVLSNEVKSLYEILIDFQEQNVALRNALKNRKPRLPAAPAREFLEQQIIMLLDYLADKNGAPPKMPKNKKVHQYITKKKHAQKTPTECSDSLSTFENNPITPRPLTSRTSPAPNRPQSARSIASSTRFSVNSAPEEVLEPLKESLNIYHIDQIANKLRESLKEEKQELLEDVEYLQSCLEMEYEEIVEEQKEVNEVPPSLEEMREFEQELEKEWLQHDKHERNSALLQHKPRSPGPFKRAPLVKPIASSGTMNKTIPHPPANDGTIQRKPSSAFRFRKSVIQNRMTEVEQK